jgi:hypothetical protein
MADLMTRIRRALGLPHDSPKSDHAGEHELIDRRLDSQARRIRALDERIDAQRASK